MAVLERFDCRSRPDVIVEDQYIFINWVYGGYSLYCLQSGQRVACISGYKIVFLNLREYL